jgi:chemotaxis response regulator CheB
MPKAAIALNAADEVLPLGDIPSAITRIFST